MNRSRNKKSPLSKMRNDNGQEVSTSTYLYFNRNKRESQEVILNDLQK